MEVAKVQKEGSQEIVLGTLQCSVSQAARVRAALSAIYYFWCRPTYIWMCDLVESKPVCLIQGRNYCITAYRGWRLLADIALFKKAPCGGANHHVHDLAKITRQMNPHKITQGRYEDGTCLNRAMFRTSGI